MLTEANPFILRVKKQTTRLDGRLGLLTGEPARLHLLGDKHQCHATRRFQFFSLGGVLARANPYSMSVGGMALGSDHAP